MKKIFFLLSSLLFSFMLVQAESQPKDATYTINTEKSNVEWFAEKVTGTHHGTIQLYAGEWRDIGDILSGSLEIDMKTILCSDIQEPEKKLKLENHLKGEDFFEVTRYPKSRFVITSVNSIPGAKGNQPNYTVSGMLTIKNKTNPISFPALIKMSGKEFSAQGEVVVDRSKFDIKYNSKSFFPNIGDKMISDNFTIKFNVIGEKK